MTLPSFILCLERVEYGEWRSPRSCQCEFSQGVLRERNVERCTVCELRISSALVREASTLPLPEACALSLLCSRPVQAGAPRHKSFTSRRGEKETTPRLPQTGQTQVSRDTRAPGFSTHTSMVDFVSSSFHDLNPTGPPSHPRVRIRHRLVIAATWKDLPVSGLSSTGAQCTPSMEETVSARHEPGFKTTQVECAFLQVATMTQWNPWQACERHYDIDCRS